MSLRDGTRLTMIRRATSPFMAKDVKFPTPLLPLVVVSYSKSLSKATCPLRVSIAETDHDLQDEEPTNNGELRRNLKLADEQGKWIHCVAHGRHAEDVSLENFRRIIVFFCSARPGTGHAEQAIWFFKEAFIVPMERRLPSSLDEPVMWDCLLYTSPSPRDRG